MTSEVPAPHQPVPAGVVSAVRGRMQAPALAWVTRAVIAVGLLSAILPDPGGSALATVVVVTVVAVPLLRVLWLVHRWRQERDQRFVALGLALLGIVAVGAALAAAGVGP